MRESLVRSFAKFEYVLGMSASGLLFWRGVHDGDTDDLHSGELRMGGEGLLGCRHDSGRRVLTIHLVGVSEFVIADRDAQVDRTR